MKTLFSLRSLVMLVGMIISAAAAYLMVPTHIMSDSRKVTKLDLIVPAQFGGWVQDTTLSPLLPPPDQEEAVKEVYDQVLARTYRNASGDAVYLTIALGGQQSRALQVHRPEVCYAAQGFTILGTQKALINTVIGALPAMRVLAAKANRPEPVTYWVRIGDKLVRGNIEQGMARLEYGLQGIIPDGLLFRVSTVENDANHSFKVQDDFVRELIKVIPADQRSMIVGKP